jgi:hypothetical protein
LPSFFDATKLRTAGLVPADSPMTEHYPSPLHVLHPLHHRTLDCASSDASLATSRALLSVCLALSLSPPPIPGPSLCTFFPPLTSRLIHTPPPASGGPPLSVAVPAPAALPLHCQCAPRSPPPRGWF